ncbi:MAG: hypothetical protein PHX52_00945 [Candidatus Pacebacteria bacterium]|nr:hypothetical protein [Candidatus Paceibacterota bacterium]MDD3919132.1 hypothetical protein [Candidatus Paceibacterota bacterium]
MFLSDKDYIKFILEKYSTILVDVEKNPINVDKLNKEQLKIVANRLKLLRKDECSGTIKIGKGIKGVPPSNINYLSLVVLKDGKI